jgi:zinc protease
MPAIAMQRPNQRGVLKTRNWWVKAILSPMLAASIFLGSLPGLGFADNLTPKVIEYKLPTGQTLYIKEDHSKPIVTIDTWVKTGSVNETERINGVSHFLEHLLFKGTSKYKPGEIDRLLEARGSEFNAATSDDFTHYYITTATPYFEEALKLHADMMVNAAIPSSELPQERKVVQEEINRANDNPDRQLYVELAKLIYNNHGYAFDTLGPKENIANIPRESILEYYHYWYQPQNFNTVIVGDVDPERVKKLVANAFPAPPFKAPKSYQAPAIGPVAPPSQAQTKVMENPNISQAYISIGMIGPAQQNPEDVYALDIAMLALGSGKSSRLYRALKETKPLATGVSAGNYTQKYSGLIVIDAEAKPENRDVVKKELLSQLATLKAKGITQAELDKAKTQYLKDFIFENETTDGTASSIGYNVTIGSLQDYQNHVNNVEKVTLEKVQAALNKYIDLDKAIMVELLPSQMKANLKAETDANLALLKETASNMTASAQAADPSNLSAKSSEPSESVASDKMPKKTVLPNGITLITKPLKDSNTVAIKIFVKGGQGVEPTPGTASLVSSVMMQGTTSRTAEMISRELESKGMGLSISTDEDFIEVTGTAIQEDFGELFTILKDVLKNPVFEDKEIAKKKEQLRQSIAASRDNPSAVAFENLSLALYPNHPYGNEGKRIEASLEKITRQDLLDYYNLYFEPRNLVVSVVGNFDPETIRNYIASLYPDCQSCPRSQVTIPAVPELPRAETVIEEKPQLSAVWLAQGWLVPPISSDKDYAALKVVNSLIGTGMSSRLFVDLREKRGLAYVVGSLYPTREQKSRFVIYIGTDPVNTEKVKEGFIQEIKRLQTEAVPEAELAEAKSKLIGSYALAHDTNVNQAYYLGLFETLGAGYEFDANYPKLIHQITPADIRQVAQRAFSSPSVLSLVKPAPKPSKTQ